MKTKTSRAAYALLLALLTGSSLACSSAASVEAGSEGDPIEAGEAADEAGSAIVRPDAPVVGSSPWTSPEACEAAVKAGKLAPRARGAARIVSWNVRWFPDGVMPKPGAVRKPTNIDWLACSVAWLDADVIALEEILNHPDAVAAMDKLVARLDVLTGGDWHADVDPCPQPRGQHQGFLYDARKATVATPHRFDWRPGDSCDLSVRPAWTGYVTTKRGFDFHLAAVHTKSGVDGRSFDLRQETLGRLPALVVDTQESAVDEDVIVAGDFNTMGRTASAGLITAEEEIAMLESAADASDFRRVPSDAPCSEYSGSRRHMLDHFLPSKSMKEISSSQKVTVTGYCKDLAFGPMPSDVPRAHTELSDHCPVMLDVDARDLD